jgi:hypothetical protein
VCGGTGSPSAAPYTGSGPHPIDFEGDVGIYFGDIDVTDSDGTLATSTGTEIEPAGWTPFNAAQVQLVACITTDFTATKVGSCVYSSGSLPLDAAKYTLTLYVARTGQKLAGPVTVQGSDQTCPATVLTYEKHPAVYTSLGLNQIEAILGKYVQ